MIFGDILKELISEKGITQREFAAEINVAPSTIGNYVNYHREPDYATLIKIADYFDVSVDYLVGHTQKDTSPNEARLIELYRSMTAEQKNMLLIQSMAVVKYNNNKK